MSVNKQTSSDQVSPEANDASLDHGFNFNPQSHTIDMARRELYESQITIDEQGDTHEKMRTDLYGTEYSCIKCTCGREFDSRQDAENHLESVYNNKPPMNMNAPKIFNFVDRTINFAYKGVDIPGKPNLPGSAAKVDPSDADILVADARETYVPPQDYDFENWAPLNEGRLRMSNNGLDLPMFNSQVLSRAIHTLGRTIDYRPERFTIYFLGHYPLYIEGAGKGILVQKQIPV